MIQQKKIVDFLRNNNLDGVFISKNENCRYITNFTGSDSFLFLTKEQIYLITDSRYTEQAKQELTSVEIIEHKGLIANTIKKLSEKHKIDKLGVEAELTYKMYLSLHKEMSSVQIIVCYPDVFREIKTQDELEKLAKACSISDEGFRCIVPYIKEGKTEHELRCMLECAMLELGSEGKSFDTIVASGVRSAMPHGIATDKVINKGELVTFDFGAIYQGYHSDITRTVAIGDISEQLRYIYDSVLGCNEYIESILKAGQKASDIDAKARSYLKERDLDKYFKHSLGHSVGLEIHEKPALSPKDHTLLKCGMTQTVEPGVYIPGIGGVRIEDTVVIEDNGISILTTYPKTFLQM